jgi:hypothetical protein
MIREHLLDAALLVRFLFQRIEMLQQQISYRVRWLELQGQHAMGGEDAQEHLHSLLDLLDAPEALIHPY